MPLNQRFTNRVTRSVLEIRSPHFYARPSASSGRTKKVGLRISFISFVEITSNLVQRHAVWCCSPYQNLEQSDHNLQNHVFDDVIRKLPTVLLTEKIQSCMLVVAKKGVCLIPLGTVWVQGNLPIMALAANYLSINSSNSAYQVFFSHFYLNLLCNPVKHTQHHFKFSRSSKYWKKSM